MTPKDKAKELVGKFYVNIPLRDCDNRRPHKLALIAVDELIEEACFTDEYIKSVFFTDGYYDRQEYWEEVKQEIELL